MVKNRVSDPKFAPRRDNFFAKSKPNFKRNDNQNKMTGFRNSFHASKVVDDSFKPSDTFKNSGFKRNCGARERIDEQPAASASGNFFVKPVTTMPSQKSKNVDVDGQEKKQWSIKKDENAIEKKEKRPFDKKQWRLKKYSKKYKLDQWEDKRKKAVLREYYKEIKDDVPKFDVQKIYDQDSENDEEENDNENNLNADMQNTTKEKSHPKNKPAIKKLQPETDSPAEENLPKKPHLSNSKTKKNIAYKKAHVEFQRIKDEKNVKKDEIEKKKAEKLDALKEYKKKKLEKYKKLNKKTRKGQPVMKDRMEMLLEQIQNATQFR